MSNTVSDCSSEVASGGKGATVCFTGDLKGQNWDKKRDERELEEKEDFEERSMEENKITKIEAGRCKRENVAQGSQTFHSVD